MSLRRKYPGILSELVPAGIIGVSMLLGSAAPSPAFGGGSTPPANEVGVLDRLSSAVEGAESSHGADAHMWRPELEGPQGPMQISAAAASDVGGGDRFDEAQNRALGRAYLGYLYRRYGSWPDAVTAYNWGPGRMNSWIGSGRPFDKFPPAVALYRSRLTITSGLAADASGTVVGGPVNDRLTRLALFRALARREMLARRRTRSGPDEVALLYAEVMRATAPGDR
jgi:hypothetical protein